MSTAITLVLDLKDNATPALLKAAHAAKSLGAQEKAVGGLQDELRRVAKEAERIRVGPEQFQINEAIKDLDRLEAKLRATNTLTDDALSTITSRRSQLTSKAADTTGRSLDGLGDRAHHMGEAFGDADSALVGFSTVLDLVNPQLGAAVRIAADVGASLEGMIRVVSVGLPIVAALGAAAAIGAVAYSKWADKSERLKQNLEATTAAMEAQKSMVEKIRDAQLDLDVALGAISESEAEIRRIRREAFIESLPAVQELTKQITAQQQAILDAKKEQEGAAVLAAAGAAIQTALPLAGAIPGALSGALSTNRAEAYRKEQTELDKLVQKRSEMMELTRGLVQVQIETNKATAANSTATDRATEALAAHNSELERMISGMDSIAGQIGGLLPAQQMTEIERLDSARTMIADLVFQFGRLSGDLDEDQTAKFAGMITQYQDALEKATTDFMGDPISIDVIPKVSTEEYIEELKRAHRVAAATKAIEAVSDPQGAMSQAGGWVGVIAAAVNFVKNIGQRDPETGKLVVKERAKAFVLALEAGLKALPKLLGNFVPWFVDFLIRKLLPALIKSGVKSILIGVPTLIANLVVMVAKWIRDLVQGFREMLKQLWDRGAFSGGSSGGGGPGSVVTRQEMDVLGLWSLVLRGESDGSASRARTATSLVDSPGLGRNAFSDPLSSIMRRQTTTGGESGSAILGGSGGVIVNISGSLVDRNVVDRLGRELNRQFGSYGRSTQPIFST